MTRYHSGRKQEKQSNWLTHLLRRKIPWRLSPRQKFRQRRRLRAVDTVVDTVAEALKRNGMPMVKAIDRWYEEMPREQEMLPKDKYTIYDRKEKKYRKGIHSELSRGLPLEVWQVLMRCFNRIAQVDTSQPTCEPSWFLSAIIL